LRLTGSRDDAEDVVQDLFVGLPRALKAYREQGRFESWLKRIAVRLCLIRLRSRKRRHEVPIDAVATELAREAMNPADIVALERVILSLPATLRSVFVLREIEGFSHDEIAAMLNITATNSAQRLSRAWRQLRKDAAHA